MNSVERKLLLGFLCSFVVLLSTLLLSYGRLSSFIGKTRDLVSTHAALRKLEKIADHFAEAQLGQQRFMTTGSRASLDACQDAFFSIERLAGEIRHESRGQKLALSRLQSLEPLVVGQINRFGLAINLARKRGLGAARVHLGGAKGSGAMRGIESVLSEFRSEESALMAGQSQEVQSMATGLAARMGAGIGSSLLIFAALFWVIHNEMRRRKAAEEKLDKRTSILSSVLNSMNDAVLVFGKDQELIVFNPAAEKLLGSPPALFDSYPLHEALMGKEVSNLVMNFKPEKSPDALYLDTSARPFLDSSGLLAGGIIVFHDISEMKREEHALLDSINQDIHELKQEEVALLESNRSLEERVGVLKQHSRDTLALSRLVESLQICRSRSEVCSAASRALSDLIEGSFGAIHLLNASGASLERAASWGGRITSNAKFDPDTCLALRRKQPSILDSAAGKTCGHFLTPLPYHCVCVPITAPGESLGQLEICTGTPNLAFMNTERLRLLAVMAEQLGLALANLRLQEALKNESIHDSLTGMYNRRHLDKSLALQVEAARRSRQPLGLAMFDIDFFKKFNDTFGHKAGDLVLQKVSRRIEECLRQGDQLFRYGGEEFTAILPGVNSQSALIAAEKARLAVSALKLEYQGLALGNLSVSIGIACFPESAESPEALISQADQALYEAKHAGRNRSVTWLDLNNHKAA